MDGLTTNGILITHPKGCFLGDQCKPGMYGTITHSSVLHLLHTCEHAVSVQLG